MDMGSQICTLCTVHCTSTIHPVYLSATILKPLCTLHMLSNNNRKKIRYILMNSINYAKHTPGMFYQQRTFSWISVYFPLIFCVNESHSKFYLSIQCSLYVSGAVGINFVFVFVSSAAVLFVADSNLIASILVGKFCF